MYNKISRDDIYVNELTSFLTKQYNLYIVEIKPADRGFFGETWIAKTDKTNYFIKIDYSNEHSKQYAKSFAIQQQIINYEIDFVPSIIKTENGDLNIKFRGGILGMFEYVEGENTEEYDLSILCDKLALIYKKVNVVQPIAVENFGTDIIKICFENIEKLKSGIINKYEQQFINCINGFRDILFFRTFRLNLFSNLCKHERHNFYLTHGDAGGNCIVSPDTFTIIDWDTPKLAPPERDAWFFMCNGQLDIFNSSLEKNKLNYKLSGNRLAYYCYYSYFYYINEYLTCYSEIEEKTIKNEVLLDAIEYLKNGWIQNQLKEADMIL